MATVLTDPTLTDTSEFAGEAYSQLRPRQRLRFAKWCVHRIVNDQNRPYDYAAYPHIVAPGGPADAIDDPRVRTISEQFATRLAKSFNGQCMLLYYADVDPCPMMLASESERSLKKKIMDRTYKMIYHRQHLADKLLYRSKRDHAADVIEFRDCKIIGAWARSPGTLADENIRVGHANELDKEGWDGHSTSVEGAPHKLFDERFKDYQSVRKVLYESTPTIKGQSRIERRRLASWNCSFFVPCPHCHRYQVLRLGAKDEAGKYDWSQPGRLQWDQREDGRDDKDLQRLAAPLDSDYKISTLGKHTSMPGMQLIHVDTIRTQLWMDKVLHRLRRGDRGSRELYHDSLLAHQDYLEQLLNDGSVLSIDPKTNQERERWERLDRNIPNDLRDCARYSYVAMLVHTRGAVIRPRNFTPPKRNTIINPGMKRPDGRDW